MLVWILKKIDLPESRIRKLVEKLTRVKIVASAVFYTLMVFIVVFGISGDVYAGFPRFVPYIIIAIFLFMAFIRMYQCMVDDSYIRQIAEKKVDDSEKKCREKAEKAAKNKAEEASRSRKEQKPDPESEHTAEPLPDESAKASADEEKQEENAENPEAPGNAQ